MTTKKAIAILESMIPYPEEQYPYVEEEKAAFYMAINALKEQEEYERKAIWLLQCDGVHCSKCGYKIQTTGLPQYCPCCYVPMKS